MRKGYALPIESACILDLGKICNYFEDIRKQHHSIQPESNARSAALVYRIRFGRIRSDTRRFFISSLNDTVNRWRGQSGVSIQKYAGEKEPRLR